MVVTKLVGQALAWPPTVFGDGSQNARCFSHVQDVLGRRVETAIGWTPTGPLDEILSYVLTLHQTQAVVV